MLQFQCPHCDNVLNIRPEHLGRTGKCNRCQGRIALLGENETGSVQMASVVGETPAPEPSKPATEAQRDYLRDLGTPEETIEGVDRSKASTLIEQKREEAAAEEPPSDAQLDLLRRLGVTDEERTLVGSKAEASRLIDQLQPRPTEHQLYYLKRLGASDDELAQITTRSQASEIIEKLLRGK